MRHSLEKLTSSLLFLVPIILVIFVPTIFLPITPDFFGIHKSYLIYALASVSLLAFTLNFTSTGVIKITKSPALLPLSIFTVIALVTTFWMHPAPRIAIYSNTALVTSLFILFLTLTSSLKGDKIIKTIITSIVSVVTLLSVFALARHFGLTSNLPSPDWFKSKLFDLTGSPYHYLTVALPVLLASIALGIQTKNWLLKPIIFTCAVLIAAGSTFSISSILPKADQAGLVLLPYNAGWSIGVDLFKDPKTALIGTGPDTFQFVFTRLKPAYLNSLENIWSLRFSNSSSELLTLMATTGIIGSLSFLLVFVLNIKQLINKNLKEDSFQAFIVAGLIGYLLMFLLVPSSIPATTMAFVFLIISIIHQKNEGHQHRVQDLSISLTANNHDSSTNLPILPWILTLSSAVLIAVYWTGAVKVYQANMAIYQAAQLLKTNGQASYNKQLEAVKLDPANPFFHVNLSQTYLAIATNLISSDKATNDDKTKATEFANQSVNEAKTAINLNPIDVSMWENYAQITRALTEFKVEGARDWTIANYAQAITLDPTNPTLRVQLGTFYYFLGDYDTAIKVLEQALNLKSDWSIPYYNIAQSYKAKKDYSRALIFMKEGVKYTPKDSKDLETINKDIIELEKLAPKESTSSGQPK